MVREIVSSAKAKMPEQKTGVMTNIALYVIGGVTLVAVLIIGSVYASVALSKVLDGNAVLGPLWRLLNYTVVISACVTALLVVLVAVWLFLAYKQYAFAQPKNVWVPPPAADRTRSCARLRFGVAARVDI